MPWNGLNSASFTTEAQRTQRDFSPKWIAIALATSGNQIFGVWGGPIIVPMPAPVMEIFFGLRSLCVLCAFVVLLCTGVPVGG